MKRYYFLLALLILLASLSIGWFYYRSTQDIFATIHTSEGSVILKLYPQKAPLAVKNFTQLAEKGRYNNIPFHRIIKDFIIQGGDYENQDGTGGQSIWNHYFKDEIDPHLSHIRGSLSMANRGPNTNGSQFFIVLKDAPHLDRRHTIFGQVVEGMERLDQMAETPVNLQNRPLHPITIQQIVISRQ